MEMHCWEVLSTPEATILDTVDIAHEMNGVYIVRGLSLPKLDMVFNIMRFGFEHYTDRYNLLVMILIIIEIIIIIIIIRITIIPVSS